MSIKNSELVSLERRTRSLWTSITRNALWVYNDKEAEYLIGGHATELIDKVSLPCYYEEYAYAKIYGMVAADKSDGRYVWIYLHYRHHIWKCYGIPRAYELIGKIKEHNKMEMKENRLRGKIENKQKSILSN